MMNGPLLGYPPSTATHRAAAGVLAGLGADETFARLVGQLQLEKAAYRPENQS